MTKQAFEARLDYEKNCIAKYDYPKHTGKHSRPPIKGERMIDFAIKYNTTVKEMKDCEKQVERVLKQ